MKTRNHIPNLYDAFHQMTHVAGSIIELKLYSSVGAMGKDFQGVGDVRV